jgi:hypothetical protein
LLIVDPDPNEEGALESESSIGYSQLSMLFELMVGEDPDLRQGVVFVAEESKRLGRLLKKEEYPPNVREAFRFPPSFPLELKEQIMSRLIMPAGKMNSWDRMIYCKRKRNCNVPRGHQEDGYNLGSWVFVQRQTQNRGELDAERLCRLQKINFVWHAFEEQWEVMFRLLEQFKNREEHCNVPQRHKEDGSNLGSWLFTQRKQKKKGDLNEDRQKRLEEIGVVWSQLEQQWEEMFRMLEQFKNREGHTAMFLKDTRRTEAILENGCPCNINKRRRGI